LKVLKKSLKSFNVIENRKNLDEKTQLNALWFGSKFLLSYVREIAKTLDSKGMKIQGIQKFCTVADSTRLFIQN